MVRNLMFPAVLGGMVIVSLCLVEQVYLKDYWGKPGVEASVLGERFALVPKDIGDWVGEDLPVDDIVKNTAGAVNYVSRRYRNHKTGREVRMWLIIGHFRDIIRHTPNICYPASGFVQEGMQVKQQIELPDGESATFYTAKFMKDDTLGRRMERVFWAWNHPESNRWDAPDSPRMSYGLTRTLYKLYFSSDVRTNENAADDSPSYEFAELMLPEVNQALFSEAAPAQPTSEPGAETSEPVKE